MDLKYSFAIRFKKEALGGEPCQICNMNPPKRQIELRYQIPLMVFGHLTQDQESAEN